MEVANELFGPIIMENFGTIMVPGKNKEERIAYATGLLVRSGIFIQSIPCVSVVTFDDINLEEPHIAIGTLDSYGCYTVEDIMMLPDNYIPLLSNLYELIMFARYYNEL